MKQIVSETQKWYQIFTRPHDSWVIDQNVQNIVLIENTRTSWPTKILMSVLSISDNLLQGACIMFQISVDKGSAQNMQNFWLQT